MRFHHWAFGLLSPALVYAQAIEPMAVSTMYIGACLSNGSIGGYGSGAGYAHLRGKCYGLQNWKAYCWQWIHSPCYKRQ